MGILKIIDCCEILCRFYKFRVATNECIKATSKNCFASDLRIFLRIFLHRDGSPVPDNEDDDTINDNGSTSNP